MTQAAEAIGARADQQLPIPSEDLARQYGQIEGEVIEAIKPVLAGGKYTMGPALAAFEAEWAAACETTFALGVSSGTSALTLVYASVGVGPGDEVVVPAMTYVATAFAASYLGAVPVFVDVDEETFNLDPEQLAGAITPRTKAIVPVHLYGQPADMDPIMAVAKEHGIPVVEDAAQAHLARYHGTRVGGLGAAACFSFYPHKNLGAYGDGGAITTNDEQLYDELRVLRYMGQRVKHTHERLGRQERLDELQAAILQVRLRHLERWTELRRRWAALYDELLADTQVETPRVQEGCTHVYYMYTVKAPRRDELQKHLAAQGIGSQVIYPTIVPDQPVYASGATPSRTVSDERARSLAGSILSLPVFPELTEEEVRKVAATIGAFYAG
jgi:dTDP-4-amino-4,6-dideoxygalactose transaminase